MVNILERFKLRNRAIANVFSQIGLIEAWGTGFKRIRNAAKEYGLPEPEFIEMPESFRVNLYRKSASNLDNSSLNDGENVGNDGEKFGESSVKFGESSVNGSVKFGDFVLNDTQIKIVEIISANNKASAKLISGKTGLSIRAIEKNIKELREKGVLVRCGAARGGHWEVKKR